MLFINLVEIIAVILCSDRLLFHLLDNAPLYMVHNRLLIFSSHLVSHMSGKAREILRRQVLYFLVDVLQLQLLILGEALPLRADLHNLERLDYHIGELLFAVLDHLEFMHVDLLLGVLEDTRDGAVVALVVSLAEALEQISEFAASILQNHRVELVGLL